MLKGNGCETPTCLLADFTQLAPLLHDRCIILWAYQNKHVLKILGCGTNQRDTSNVDLFLSLTQCRIWTSNCLGKRVQVDNDDINRHDMMCLQFIHMFRYVTTS